MQKKYFIGIDSDGTAFDSMTIKHRQAFIPALLQEWHFEAYRREVTAICEEINLFSPTRGIDRFSGLIPTFERLQNLGIPLPEFRALRGFLASPKLSNATLTTYVTAHPDPFLRQVLHWSQTADQLFQEAVKNLPPFRGVVTALQQIDHRAEVAVISSASERSLQVDWQKENLVSYVDVLYGQEFGTKKVQLQTAITGHFRPECAMMIGDAQGDYAAAQAVHAWFYPMLPGREEESWDNFRRIYLEKFLNGEFDAAVQEFLLKQFYEVIGVKK